MTRCVVIVVVLLPARARHSCNEDSVTARLDFDFVVVGAGSAGSTVAARLASRREDWSILLCERGGPDDPKYSAWDLSRDDRWVSFKASDPTGREDWEWMAGRGFGGTSQINGLRYIRGGLEEFPWPRDQVLDAFRSVEELVPAFGFSPAADYHPLENEPSELSRAQSCNDHSSENGVCGRGAPVTLLSAREDELPILHKELVTLFEGRGVPWRLDPHDNETNRGIGGQWRFAGCAEHRCGPMRVARASMATNRPRQSAYNALISRFNITAGARRLIVAPKCKVEHVLIDDNLSVLGVMAYLEGKCTNITASKEVVLSAGVFESPGILLRSGIGPEACSSSTSSSGDQFCLQLPVGLGLTDHLFLPIGFAPQLLYMRDCDLSERLRKSSEFQGDIANLQEQLAELMAFVLVSDFADGLTGSDVDAVIELVEACFSSESAFMFHMTLLKTFSRGRVFLEDNEIKVEWFPDSRDSTSMAILLHTFYELLRQFPSLDRPGSKMHLNAGQALGLYSAGSNQTFKEIVLTIASVLQPANHATGTCVVGSVVDETFRVYGLKGLRIADASTLPQTTSYTDAAARMVGEMASRYLIQEWSGTQGSAASSTLPGTLSIPSFQPNGCFSASHSSCNAIPIIAFGTAGLHGPRAVEAVLRWLALGGRHIDTASFYENHHAIGEAMRLANLPREELFLTSKIHPELDEFGESSVNAVERIVADLGTNYIDLLLLHQPGSLFVESCGSADNWASCRRNTWRALTPLVRRGSIRALGVSNFAEHHLIDLFSIIDQEDLAPVQAMQTELHLFWRPSSPVMRVCQNRGVHLFAYATMQQAADKWWQKDISVGQQQLEALQVAFTTLAAESTSVFPSREVVPAKSLIRWVRSQGFGLIVQATREQHMRENLEAVVLEPLHKTIVNELSGIVANSPHLRRKSYPPDPDDLT